MPHDHLHGIGHQEETGEKLSPRGKLGKMVEYWMHHNEDHARSYRDWAKRAGQLGEQEACRVLERLADEAVLANRDLARVLLLLKAQPASH